MKFEQTLSKYVRQNTWNMKNSFDCFVSIIFQQFYKQFQFVICSVLKIWHIWK